MTLENITDLDHKHAERVWKDFGIQNLGDYHCLYVSSDTLLLADAFKKFQNQILEIYELDPVHLVSEPGLAWQACLKKTAVQLEF